jgi:hypothetical protein
VACEQMRAVKFVCQCPNAGYRATQAIAVPCYSPTCMRSAAASVMASTPARCSSNYGVTFAAQSWTRRSSVCSAYTLALCCLECNFNLRNIRVEDEEVEDEEALKLTRFYAASRILVLVASFL